VENSRLHRGRVFGPSDGYGVYAFVIDHGKEIKYGGGVESAWGGIDLTVEVMEGEELKIMQRVGMLPPKCRCWVYALNITLACIKHAVGVYEIHGVGCT
jgi:hypothetical protein